MRFGWLKSFSISFFVIGWSFLNLPQIVSIVKYSFVIACIKKQYRFNSSDELQSVHNTMMNSLAIPWTIEKLAKSANMSVSTFQRQYVRLYGKTPIADLWDRRFKKAKMLLNTGYSIPWILHSCCFKSHQHFSKFFKEREGISPGEYIKRKQSKDEQEHTKT